MNKKRILPVIVSIFLVAGTGGVAANADTLFVDGGASPLLAGDSYENQRLSAGDTVTVYLNSEIFRMDGEGAQLTVNAVNNGGEAFGYLFGEPQFDTGPLMTTMRLPVIDRYYTADVLFDCQLSFTYSDGALTASSQGFRFAGVVTANAAGPATAATAAVGAMAGEGYRITGWNPAQAGGRRSYELTPGSWAQYGTLRAAELFAYTGAGLPAALDDALVEAYALGARTGSLWMTARLQRAAADDYRIYLEVDRDTPAGVYDVAIEVYSANAKLPGSFVYERLEVTVPRTAGSGAAAVRGGRITGINPDGELGYARDGVWSAAEKNGRELPRGDEALDNLWVRAGDEIRLYFDSDFFEWQDGAPSPATTALTPAELRRGNIAARALSGRHSDLLETVELGYQNGRAYVRAQFVDPFVSTADVDFEIDIVLTYRGRYIKGTEAYLCGTIYNDYSEAWSDLDYIDLSGGEVVDAVDTIADIEVYLGEGVSIFTRMIKGRSYYGVATYNELDDADEAVFDEHPDVLAVYHLATVGLSSNEKNVRIDSEREYYVYNRYLDYIGTTGDRLPYSTRYYLAARKLDTAAVSPTAAAGSAGNTETTGTAGTAGSGVRFTELPVPTGATPGPSLSNTNSNPYTGR